MRTLVSFGTIAVILSTFMWHANYIFALNQNSLLLPPQQQRIDIVNVDNSNITKKFTLIADEKVVTIYPNNFSIPKRKLVYS